MKLFRVSGAPIDPRHQKKQLDGMNAAMDELEDKLGKCTQENAEMFQKALTSVHEELAEEFPNCVNIKYPRAKRDMHTLCEKFGSMAFCLEDGKVVAYILDK